MNRGFPLRPRPAGPSTTWFVVLLVTGGLLAAPRGVAGPGRVSAAVAAEASSGWIAGRAGYIALETFGRDESITHVEVLPYAEAGQHTLFADLRFFMSDEGLFGGNAGFGYRFGMPAWNRFFGASLWYDADDTTGEMFHQVGLSLETYGAFWDFRSNLYFPVGDDERQYQLGVQNQRFAGNQILYDGSRTFGEAMEGLDVEFGVPLPSALAARHDLRANVGGYFFFGDAVSDICGYRVRVEGNVTENVAAQVEMTDDGTFGTNVTVGVAIAFPGRPCGDAPSCFSCPRRADEFVRRNYNVIVSKQRDVVTDRVAVNPDTGDPYVVQHVAGMGVSSAGGLDIGTVEDPFDTIAEAQAAGGDVIFVHAGSVLGDALALEPGDRILGEGIDHRIDYGTYGTYLLPTATGGTVRPTISGVAGTAVTLASDSRFAGFVVDGPSGHGIVGESTPGAAVQNVELAGVDVRNTGLDGVVLNDVGGTVSLDDVNVANTTGTGIAVHGGSAEHAFGGVSIENAGGSGLSASSAAGSLTFDTLHVDGAAAGPGVSIVDSAAETTFDNLHVTTENTTGLFVKNGGLLAIGDGTIAATGATAVDVEDTETDVTLTRVSSDGAAVGLRLVDTPDGTFTVAGAGALGTGGLMQNATNGVLLDNAGTVNLSYLDLDANAVGIDATDTEFLRLRYCRVTNSTTYGVDSLNTQFLRLYDSTLENNGGPGSNGIRAYADTLGEYEYILSRNTFVDDSDAALAIYTTGAADASSLTLQFESNDVAVGRLGADGVSLVWGGPIAGVFADNQFAASGGSNDAIDITGNSSTDEAQFRISGNAFTFSGGDDTGVRITTIGASFLNVHSNDVTFDASSGVGMDFDLAESAEVYIYQNTVTDNVSGGTGIRFGSIAGPSEVSIDSNRIDLLSSTGILDYGIVFSSITDEIDLFGTYNNVVNGATTDFFAPVGTTNGHIYVNGSAVP